MKIKILVVEDHELVRQGVISLLESDPEIEVIGEAQNGEIGLKEVGILKPDLVLMDLGMPVMNGLECTRLLKERFPDLKILALSMYDDESYLTEMMEAGADGYVLKNITRDDLITAIKKIMDGGIYVGHGFKLKALLSYNAAGKNNNKVQSVQNLNITDRELDVLKLVAEGLTNVEMSERLFTSVRTIETRRKKLLEKTNTSNTATLIKFAVQNGLID